MSEKSTVKKTHVNLRIRMTETEKSFIERVAYRYGLSVNRYVEACLRDKFDRLSIMAQAGRFGQAPTAVTFRFLAADVARARQSAKKLGHKLSAYIRLRALGGLTYQPPKGLGPLGDGEWGSRMRALGVKSRRGRPRREELLMAAAGGDLLKALCLDEGEMKRAIENIFATVRRAGVDPGDMGVLLEVLKRVVRVELTRVPTGPIPSDPGTTQETAVRLRLYMWSPLHGVVEIGEPSPEVRAAGATKRMFATAPPKMMSMSGEGE